MENKVVESETMQSLRKQYEQVHQGSPFFREVMLIQEDIKRMHLDKQSDLVESLTLVRQSHFEEWFNKVQELAKSEFVKRQQQEIGISMRIDRLATQYLPNKRKDEVRDRVISTWVQEGNTDA